MRPSLCSPAIVPAWLPAGLAMRYRQIAKLHSQYEAASWARSALANARAAKAPPATLLPWDAPRILSEHELIQPTAIFAQVTPAPPNRSRLIMADVVRSTGVPFDEICGRDKRADIMAARFEACWRLRSELGLSYPQIGRLLGGRDHATILHAVRKIAKARGLSVPGGAVNGAKDCISGPLTAKSDP